MSKWSEFYQGRCNSRYMEYVLERYQPFLGEILRDEPLRLLEEGCGVGTISKCLIAIDPGIDPYLSDNCVDQLRLAEANTGLKPMQSCIVKGGNDTFADVIHGHGILEHFSDDDVLAIINRQWQLAPKVVHYVPTNKYKTPSFGDERLLPVEYWLSFQPTRHFTFNDGYDLCLIWENTNEQVSGGNGYHSCFREGQIHQRQQQA